MKSKKGLPIPPLPKERSRRKRTGYDVFRNSEDPARPRTKSELEAADDPSAQDWNFGDWTRRVKLAWGALPEAKKEEFEHLAAGETERIMSEEISEAEERDGNEAEDRKRRQRE